MSLTIDEVEKKCKELAEELANVGYEILFIIGDNENELIAGNMCPVCAQDTMNNFITRKNIKHNDKLKLVN